MRFYSQLYFLNLNLNIGSVQTTRVECTLSIIRINFCCLPFFVYAHFVAVTAFYVAAGPANILLEHDLIYIQTHFPVLLSQLQSRLRKETGSSVTSFSLSGTVCRVNTKSLCTFVLVQMMVERQV